MARMRWVRFWFVLIGFVALAFAVAEASPTPVAALLVSSLVLLCGAAIGANLKERDPPVSAALAIGTFVGFLVLMAWTVNHCTPI